MTDSLVGCVARRMQRGDEDGTSRSGKRQRERERGRESSAQPPPLRRLESRRLSRTRATLQPGLALSLSHARFRRIRRLSLTRQRLPLSLSRSLLLNVSFLSLFSTFCQLLVKTVFNPSNPYSNLLPYLF